MIKVIIFDLNGVFIQSEKLSDRFYKDFRITPDKFLPVLKDILFKVRTPNAGDSFDYWAPHLEEWKINLNREKFWEYWFSEEREVPEMVQLARELKERGARLFILSNNFIERATYYKNHFPFLDKLFEKIYYSWQTGFVKPAVGAYKIILNENNLRAEECLYFDDVEKNIEVARSLGIKAFLFEVIRNTQGILEKML